ncbi:MAG: Gfo/Idh/MocA family protein [Planctomycetota bacterium]
MYSVCVIGCGGISESHYSKFEESGRARVTACYDIDPEAAMAKAEAWGAEVLSSGKECVRDDIDIVVISTPGFARLEYVKLAAEAGKHIICEKPIALNLEEALVIQEVVHRTGITFQVNFTQRFNPPFVTLHDVAERGDIGGTVAAWAHLDAPASTARWLKIVESGHWRSSMELSGGRINEFCSHTINWLIWNLGKPLRVYGKAMIVTEGFNLDDSDMAVIECERGNGQLFVNRHAGVATDEHYGVLGHGGSVTYSGGKVRMTTMDNDPVDIERKTDVPQSHVYFLDCLEQGTQPINDIDDAVNTLRVCLAFNRSAETGKVEEV